MNRLFLHTPATRVMNNHDICVMIGSRGHSRRVYLSEAEASQLAYKLMSLAAGGSTNGRSIQLGKDFGQ